MILRMCATYYFADTGILNVLRQTKTFKNQHEVIFITNALTTCRYVNYYTFSVHFTDELIQTHVSIRKQNIF